MSAQTATDATPAPGSAGAVPAVQLDRRARTLVLVAIMLTLFLASLDQTVVGTALPRIVTDLSGANLYTWVVTAYLLSSTITGPIYGKFSDTFGAKPMLIIGVVLFLFGSALSGLSQNMTELIAFRTIQGLGAGAIFPIALAVIGAIFTPRERGRYQGLFGAVFGLSFIVGPFTGGWITDNISWHWVFYVNLPVGLLALAVLWSFMPNPPHRQARLADVDLAGIALFTAGVVPFLIGLSNKGETSSNGQLYAWTDPRVGGLIILGLALLGAFIGAEARAAEPIMPLDLFRSRDYAASMMAVLFYGVAMFTAIIFMPRFYQTVRGISATASGYYVWPLLVGLMGGSIGSGQVISRIGRYKWLLVGAAFPLLAGAFLLTHLTRDTPDTTLWVWLLLIGVGLGPAMAGFTVVIQNAVPVNRLGVATSTMTFLRQVGASTGLAIANTVFLSYFTGQLPRSLAAHGVPPAVAARVIGQGARLQGVGGANVHVPPQLVPLLNPIRYSVFDAFSGAVANLFWISVSAGIVALLATLTLRDRRLRGLQPVAAVPTGRSRE